jgi:hypothetical protein
MKKYLLILLSALCVISCKTNHKLMIDSSSKENTTLDLNLNKPNESVYLKNDTIDLFYTSTNKQIVIKLAKNRKQIVDKILTKDNFIEDGVISKSSLSIQGLTSNGFDKNYNYFVFTVEFKSSNSKYSDIEATFSIDLKGEFNLSTD